jgi:hypothetical protein
MDALAMPRRFLAEAVVLVSAEMTASLLAPDIGVATVADRQ